MVNVKCQKKRLKTFFEQVFFVRQSNLYSEFIEDFTRISEERQDMAIGRASSTGVWSARTHPKRLVTVDSNT